MIWHRTWYMVLYDIWYRISQSHLFLSCQQSTLNALRLTAVCRHPRDSVGPIIGSSSDSLSFDNHGSTAVWQYGSTTVWQHGTSEQSRTRVDWVIIKRRSNMVIITAIITNNYGPGLGLPRCLGTGWMLYIFTLLLLLSSFFWWYSVVFHKIIWYSMYIISIKTRQSDTVNNNLKLTLVG